MITWFKNQKISKKLILGFLIVAFLTAIVGAVGVVGIWQVNKADTELYEENTLGLQYIGEAAKSFQRLRYNSVMLAMQDTSSGKEKYKTTLAEVSAIIDETGANYQKTIVDAEDKKLFDQIIGRWTTYKATVETLIKIADNSTQKEMMSLIASTQTLGDEIRNTFDELTDFNATDAKDKSDSNDKKANLSMNLAVVVVVVSIILAIILGVFISRSIGKPITKVAQMADLLSIGDININAILTDADRASLQRKDEVGQLAASFGKLIHTTQDQVEATRRLATGDLTMDMKVHSEKDLLGKSLQSLVDSLNDIATSISSTSGQVAAGASAISDSSMMLSQGATEQASSIEELTASVEEISAQTSQNAKNAERANELAINAADNAKIGDAQMSEMLKAIDAINISSGNISKIIKVIDDIAFQTNILALNAAVEAARAGQHGKGFAVVAEEVRTLAAKSASAAKETTDMIEGSIRNVDSGIRIAKDTADALKNILTEVSNAAELVGEIATASNEQALGIGQLNEAIMQVSKVVQMNAATSEEAAAASEELAGQANQLKEVVSIFKIKQSKMHHIPEQPSSSSKVFENKTNSKTIAPQIAKANISLVGDFDKY